jgi:two-component system, cell cycle sensor histidine kinase and response regulator CckA
MYETQVVGGLALSVQLCTAFYALRLNRLFGTNRAGWSLFGAFALMLALHLTEAWGPSTDFHASGELMTQFVYLISSALLFIGLVHVGLLFQERLRTEQVIRSSRDQLEERVQERTAQLAESNVSLQVEIAERTRAEGEIRAVQLRYRELIDSVDCIVFEAADEDLRFTFVSPQCERLLGYSSEEWLSRLTWRNLIHPDDYEMVVGACQASLKAKTRATLEFRVRAADGREVWVRQLTTVTAENGQPPTMRGVLLDITERRGMELQLRQAQRLESIGRLAGGVAHDFNNILTIIQGHAGCLSMLDQLPGPMRESLDEIQFASERAAQLTAQLLAFGRRQTVQWQVLDLNQLTENAMKMLRRVLGEHIHLRPQLCSGPALIKADGAMIEQMLMNLVVNAKDAMPKGGELSVATSTVTLAEEYVAEGVHFPSGAYVCLKVSDTGCGIAPEILPRIFEPFFTTKDVGKGSGLGLAMAYGIVRQHDGWIKAASAPGQGATFEVHLPASSECPAEPPAQEKAAPSGNGETILLVEDESALRKVAARILSRCGYKVLEAESGVQALGIWQQNPAVIDLLLTDIVMPEGVNGWELAEKLVAERPDLKVLCTSGYVPDTAESNPGIRLLPKPYDSRQLLMAVQEVLAQQRAV